MAALVGAVRGAGARGGGGTGLGSGGDDCFAHLHCVGTAVHCDTAGLTGSDGELGLCGGCAGTAGSGRLLSGGTSGSGAIARRTELRVCKGESTHSSRNPRAKAALAEQSTESSHRAAAGRLGRTRPRGRTGQPSRRDPERRSQNLEIQWSALLLSGRRLETLETERGSGRPLTETQRETRSAWTWRD